MIVVTGGRRAGKTSAVIRWLLEDVQARAIIVADRRERDYVLRMIEDFAKVKYNFRPHVLSASDLQIGGFYRGHSMRALHFPQVAIDDATRVFKVLFGVDLDFMSVNATWIPLAPTTDTVKAEVVNERMIESVAFDDDEHFDPSPPRFPIDRRPL